MQLILGFTIPHLNGTLSDDRARIHPSINPVHSTAGDLDPISQRVPHTVSTRERRQQRRMRIHRPIPETLQKRRPQNPHKPRTHHHIRGKTSHRRSQRRIPASTRIVIPRVHHKRFSTQNISPMQTSRPRLIRTHRDYLHTRQTASGNRINNGLKIRTRPRKQNNSTHTQTLPRLSHPKPGHAQTTAQQHYRAQRPRRSPQPTSQPKPTRAARST